MSKAQATPPADQPACLLCGASCRPGRAFCSSRCYHAAQKQVAAPKREARRAAAVAKWRKLLSAAEQPEATPPPSTNGHSPNGNGRRTQPDPTPGEIVATAKRLRSARTEGR